MTPTWRKRARNARHLARETTALRLLGPGIVRLLSVEDDVLVLERIDPGDSAAGLDDEAATRAIAAALQALWVPVPPGCTLPDVATECRALDGDTATAQLPADLVRAARTTRDALLADAPPPVVLHGDLHPGNLLRDHARGWVVIDPHGLTGDPAYDLGPLLINPLDGDPASLLDGRLDLSRDCSPWTAPGWPAGRWCGPCSARRGTRRAVHPPPAPASPWPGRCCPAGNRRRRWCRRPARERRTTLGA